MDTSLIPNPDTLPVNWWWFQGLLIFTFLIHIILMNLLLGGSLLSFVDLLTKKKHLIPAKSIPTLIALTVNFGVPPLLFVQVLWGNLFYTSSVIMALPWIMVVLILIVAYYMAYIFVAKMNTKGLVAKISLGISSAILLTIAFIYVNNMTLSLHPQDWQVYFEKDTGNYLNWAEPTLWPRYLHFVVGAIAIAGLGRAAYYFFSKKVDEETKATGMKSGLKIFGITTLVQMGVGIWFWLSLPENIWKLFMGGNLVYTILICLGILCGLLIAHAALTGKMKLSLILGLITLTIMLVVRELVRQSYMKDIFHPKDMEIVSQASPLIVFLLVFVVGLALIYYMLKLAFKPKSE